MMRRIASVVSATCFYLAGIVAAFFALAPWIIGSQGGSGAGMVGFGLLYLGALYGIPTIFGLALIGFVTKFVAGRRAP